MGGVDLGGDGLRFTTAASTLMACTGGSTMEQTPIRRPEATRGHRLPMRRLDLYDGAGNRLAGFVAER